MLEKITSLFRKNSVDTKINKDFVQSMSNIGYSYLGDSLNDCGNKVEFTLNSYYGVQTYSTEAQAYKNKITSWVGKGGLYLENKNGEVYDNQKELDKVLNVFKNPTLSLLKQQYFTHYFCSGDLYFYPQTNLLGEIKAQLLDSRTMQKYMDKMNNIAGYRQMIKGVPKDIPADKIYNSIVRFNPNNPVYGASVYESILYDALSEKESSKRSFYFFKNNAMPNVIFMLNPDVSTDQVKEINENIKQKYQGSENANRFMASNAVTGAQVLDMNNKDLDLINLREFFIQKMGITFQIDPRLIGFVKDVGSYASIKEIRKEASETLQSLSNDFENDLNNFYLKFVDKKFQYKIRVDSETFDDVESIREGQRKDIALGLQTIEQVWMERGYDLTLLPEQAKKPLIGNNLKLLEKEGETIE